MSLTLPIHSDHGQEVLFEVFEASPRSDDVLATEHALQWNFPGSAVAVPYSTFTDASFQDSLAGFLEQCSTESIKRFAARAAKAGSFAIETRDTVEPTMITTLLMTLLEVHGRRVSTPLLRKRVRDNVCWSEGAENPWRRLPFWLVMRVGIARYLATKHGGEIGRLQYKFLMCLVLARVLEDGLYHLDPQSTITLKAKLTRRLAKLEVAKGRCSPNVRSHYEVAFTGLNSVFQTVLRKANQHIEATWTSFKAQIKRPIRSLPRRANEADLRLTLPNSGLYLETVLTYPFVTDGAHVLSGSFNMSAVNQNLKPLATSCFSLSQFETDVENGHFVHQLAKSSHAEACIDLGHKLDQYADLVGSTYDGIPEQKSIMILTVMELWMLLDQRATAIFGLLLDFAPGLAPDVLDVLQLPRFSDMRRLQKIQEYLRHRQEKCNFSKMTIFEDPSKDCFAERYFDESDDGTLEELHQRVQDASERARADKEEEWEDMSKEYEQLERRIAESTCMYVQDGLQTRHDDRCTKCYMQRCAKRMSIAIHEHFLPSNPVHAKALIFELSCPLAFSAYRNATWKILGTLAQPKLTDCFEPRLRLEDYEPLKRYSKKIFGGVSLASTTKTFLKTHYRGVRFPADLDNVCLPNGLKLAYFDSFTTAWPGRLKQRPSFAHQCPIMIPTKSPFAVLQSLPEFAPGSNGPSSNEIIASQTKCPAGLNTHEYMAFQGIFSGKHRRWPLILLELASSNLNFSTEAITHVISQLSSQVGPADDKDALRMTHQVFRDQAFCERLLDQVRIRFEVVSANWRETNSMDMLITLLLRLINLACEDTSNAALKLLEQVGEVTYGWINALRTEIHRVSDADASRRCSRYSLWAALLCRRTFLPYCEDSQSGFSESLSGKALQRLIESSITLQDNMVSNPNTLPRAIRLALVRDLKMTYRIRFCIRQSVTKNPDALTAAIDNIWPGATSRAYSEPNFLDNPYNWWIQLTVQHANLGRQQMVHYDILEGHLLIDNKPLGRLPAEHRDSVVLSELFGQQSLLAYPSGLFGMTYMLAFSENGHGIHLGLRGGKPIVRACFRGRILELVPRTVFIQDDTYDLPASMVDNCVHWLDVNSGILEIRQSPDQWIQKQSNWSIDMRTRIAKRRESRLVDPHSPLFRQFASIFDYFEDRRLVTVYQPSKAWPLSVELRRLEMNFYVNGKQNLYCRELRAEIDPNQDAGTWYGLNSKLVLRDPMDLQARSIIVPMGALSYQQNKFHVAVKLQPNGNYAKFSINHVLGRLDCPAEPWILYLKAQLHAYTSSILPDPLTGRTGAEEALHLLKSGICQPWSPLQAGSLQCLLTIADLTANREYYPLGLKTMQNVCWNSRLTTTIQRDEYLPLVKAICQKSSDLLLFASAKSVQPEIRNVDSHLLQRSINHRRLYDRIDEIDSSLQPSDLTYHPRDRPKLTQLRHNVFESVALISRWSPDLPTTTDLVGALQKWPTIQGHGQSFDKYLLSDCLDVQFGLQWGSLVDYCRGSTRDRLYPLSFMFAMLSFSANADMDLIRTLIAFTISERLKQLEPPKWPSYSHFRPNHVPTMDNLTQLMKPFRVPYEGDERSQFNVTAKVRRMLEAKQQAHEEKSENDCRTLANFLLKQWPCAEPALEGLPQEDPLLLDIPQALAILKPEWLRLFQNSELSQYIAQVQQVLNHFHLPPATGLLKLFSAEEEVFFADHRGGEVPSLVKDLLRKPSISPAPSEHRHGSVQKSAASAIGGGPKAPSQWTLAAKENVPTGPRQHLRAKAKPTGLTRETMELENIIDTLSKSKSTVRQHYAQDLKQSLDSLKGLDVQEKHNDDPILPLQLAVATSEARQKVEKLIADLRRAFERADPRAKWLKEGGLWPCTTTVVLLEQLRSTSTADFGSGMKESLLEYALALTRLQRLLRLREANLKGNHQKYEEEQSHTGHENWQPASRPDWLLLEIDANILIRPSQVDVALATISPASDANSVLQMNMGQGKTSCIIPMVAASLADTKRLVRVVVPKALLLQTAQLMQARLGGLLGREVRHVPFSRRTPTAQDTTKAFWAIHKDVMSTSGVMVALPEHIMSFMLSGMQRVSDNRIAEATPMVNIQTWMRKVCRDILDESDFTLAVRTQLIYPSGQQSTVDGHPHRWETAQALLRSVEAHLWNLQQEFPRSIEVIRRSTGGFPLAFFLRKDVEDALTARIVNDILRGQTSILPTRDCDHTERQAIRQYITSAVVRQPTADKIQAMFPDKPVAKQNLHLLRGLIVHRILIMTLKKRWSVQYGLHPARDPIAVPYHAKGVPSDQAEWGHPDVAILFTCLSFYFEGLTLDQLRQSLEHVVKSDDPSSEYDRWTHSNSNIPGSLRDWNVINVDDETQLCEIWQQLRSSIVVIDYYLNHFVFPKHAKQFKLKLQSSGWDIPLVALTQPSDTKLNGHKPLTTGFSGTNDNRTLLPLTIKQQDLPGLSHTNAEVLTYLLQPRNRLYVLAADKLGKRISEVAFLHKLRDRRIRMLLDAGAQILELDNLGLARAWLRVDTEAKAALYFNADNRPFVLYRNGSKVPLLASPFADDLTECLVYLDEAHTRGTDLKMPSNAKGALTLGLGQSKDHTVQGLSGSSSILHL